MNNKRNEAQQQRKNENTVVRTAIDKVCAQNGWSGSVQTYSDARANDRIRTVFKCGWLTNVTPLTGNQPWRSEMTVGNLQKLWNEVIEMVAPLGITGWEIKGNGRYLQRTVARGW